MTNTPSGGPPPPPPYGQQGGQPPPPPPPGWGPPPQGGPWGPAPPSRSTAPPPTPPQAPPAHRDRDPGNLLGGLVVVGIGLFLLLMQFVPDAGRWIPLGIGAAFLAAFVARREYGFLIPGAILGGIGVGIILADIVGDDYAAAAIVLSLAGGFASIWLVSVLTGIPGNKPGEEDAAESAWWPLIPGGILALVGVVVLTDIDVGNVARWWPVIVILIGLLILGRALAARRRAS